MKKMFVFPILLSVLFFACHKKDEMSPITPTGTVELHLHNYIDVTEVDAYDQIITTSDNRKISLSVGQFYMSNLQLVRDDGNFISVDGKIILKRQEEDVYYVGEVPEGNYTAFRFNVGLDPELNAIEPVATDTALYHGDMWYGSMAQPWGYAFLNAQGMIDTTTGGGGAASAMQPFKFKIGSDVNYKQVVMNFPTVFKILPKELQFIHMYADYNKLFHGISLNTANLIITTPDQSSSDLAKKIANNIPSMFAFE